MALEYIGQNNILVVGKADSVFQKDKMEWNLQKDRITVLFFYVNMSLNRFCLYAVNQCEKNVGLKLEKRQSDMHREGGK